MEEELNEDELEERLYAMIHYADESLMNVGSTTQNEPISDISANPPRSTLRRYWRTSSDHTPTNTHYQKVYNHSKDASTPQNNKTIKPNSTQLEKVNTPLKLTTTPFKQITTPQKQIATPHKQIITPQKQTSNPKNTISTNKVIAKPKEEKDEARKSPIQTVTDLALFFSSPITSNTKTTVKILENDESHHPVELETSDEDEVVVVALPPKPIISIESSDEDEISIVTPQQSIEEKNKSLNKRDQQKNGKRLAETDRDISTSPVPSVVSSVSDEFIRGDCIALNISSQRPDHHDFDFSLHGSDLIDTPPRKKKKKKNKDCENTTPLAHDVTPGKTIPKASDECFATPKSKSKNKKQKPKSYAISAVPNPDIYDSDSNQSFDASKKENTYKVTEKSLPSTDVYESDSSQQSEITKTNIKTLKEKSSNDIERSDSSICLTEKQPEVEPKKTINVSTGAAVLAYAYKQLGKETKSQSGSAEVIDLTDEATTIEDSNIEENIVMANVTGFEESDDYGEEQQPPQNKNAILGSTREPAILSADLDFDNLKGKEKVCKKRCFSLATLGAEMEKFYNESWGGEDFNHQEIQKTMSRDKSLWEIDPKDKIPYYSNRRKVTCNYCHRVGHRDDTCRLKPSVCHMCGNTGHHEPRCPNKICVNCGSPNYMYSSVCRNCSTWGRLTCAECNQLGHPSSHCPDLWRRYHDTLSENEALVEMYKSKKHHQLYCSGCSRRGHLIHTCRNTLPFSGLPINSPYVAKYLPVYRPTPDRYQNTRDYGHQQNYQPSEENKRFSHDSTTPKMSERNKRHSKSPTWHENHINKKRHMSTGDIIDEPQNIIAPIDPEKQVEETTEPEKVGQRSRTVSENKVDKNRNEVLNTADSTPDSAEKAPDFIPISSANHDKRGQIIQDNEVSDTSDVVTSARIYVTNDIADKLKTKEGIDWLNEKMKTHNVYVTHSDVNLFLNIKGKLVDQESFQNDLRDWIQKPNNNKQQNVNTSQEVNIQSHLSDNIPKNRNNVLRKLSRAFESLKEDLGDPKLLFNKLNYLQENQAKLLKQKVISPQKVTNNKQNINEMLTKLNMVLLGQAGLADGSRHLRQLHSLQERLTNYRQKNLSVELRKEIGEHYHSIFAATPRGDYRELLDRYYVARHSPNLAKKNRNKLPAQKKKNNFTSQVNNKSKVIPNPGAENMACLNMPPLPKNKGMQEVQVTVKSLFSLRRRLLQVHPSDGVLKKAHKQLVRKLHIQIASLDKKCNITAKNCKKISKLKKQAILFLQNNV